MHVQRRSVSSHSSPPHVPTSTTVSPHTLPTNGQNPPSIHQNSSVGAALNLGLIISLGGVFFALLGFLFVWRYLYNRKHRNSLPSGESMQTVSRGPPETPEEREARRVRRMTELDRDHPPMPYHEWVIKKSANFAPRAEALECCICLKKLENMDQIRELDCEHCYHKHCLDDWLQLNHNQCPLCRNSIIRMPPETYKGKG